MMNLNQVELFAGVGGFGLAGRWAGIKTTVQIEIDEYCYRNLTKNFPEAIRFRNIKNFTYAAYKSALRKKGVKNRSIDIVSGGFPCQPASDAGLRLGTADDRWLWPEMFRFIKESRPAVVLAENVTGLVSMDGGDLLGSILADLEGEGYWNHEDGSGKRTIRPLIIPAVGRGAPHKRNRVWIVAHADGRRRKGRQPEDFRVQGTACCKWPGQNYSIARSYPFTAHTNGQRQQQPGRTVGEVGGWVANSGQECATTDLWAMHCRPTFTDTVGISGEWCLGGWRGQSESSGSNIIAPHTYSPRLEKREGGTGDNGPQCAAIVGNPWSEHWLPVATRICGIFNGLSIWMDRVIINLQYEKSESITGQNLPYLWHHIQQEALWCPVGRRKPLLEKAHLFAVLWQYFARANRQDSLPFESAEVQDAYVRNVWHGSKPGCPPQGWGYNEEHAGEYSDAMPLMSHEITLEATKIVKRYNKDRGSRLKALGNAIVPYIAYEIFIAIVHYMQSTYATTNDAQTISR